MPQECIPAYNLRTGDFQDTTMLVDTTNDINVITGIGSIAVSGDLSFGDGLSGDHANLTNLYVSGVVETADLNVVNNIVVSTDGNGYSHNVGSVVQATSNTTGVSLNNTTGSITMFDVLNASSTATFTLNNTVVNTNSLVFLQAKASQPLTTTVVQHGAGIVDILVSNAGASPTSAAPKIFFWVLLDL